MKGPIFLSLYNSRMGMMEAVPGEIVRIDGNLRVGMKMQ